ncbi:MAG TPA: DUF6797 domain-containing protein [Opitutus sp.]|nr:DUF6797 domain-containing protein [Opitutus sp.]
MILWGVAVGLGVSTAESGRAAGAKPNPAAHDPWGDWVEPNFPFFSAVVDARKAGAVSPADNLTPRGLVLNLGGEAWACFDTELLRVSAVWDGNGLTPFGLAAISYHDAGQKTPEGQSKLPTPRGSVWLANGIYPGWQSGERLSLADPRPSVRSPQEIGRGPLTRAEGRFRAIRLSPAGACLCYTAHGANIEELITALPPAEGHGIRRTFRVGPAKEPLLLALGLKRPANSTVAVSVANRSADANAALLADTSAWLVRVAPHDQPAEFCVTISRDRAIRPAAFAGFPAAAEKPAPSFGPQSVTTHGTLASGPGAYVVDNIALPLDNPWHRNVRLADVQFFRSGRAAAVTFDGDVWLIDGLKGNLDTVTWRRFASGLHEPQSLAIRDDEVFVFDRNGIWRLKDRDGDGMADEHELFCNEFTQTAETREFANSMKLAPDGSFVIAKGGQEGATLGRDNGTVIRVAPDGKSITRLGWGFRQPFIGVNPRTGLVTASDQEGNYVPTTPLYIVRDGKYYGFLSSLQPREKYPAPIAEPLLWIPHMVNASGASQVWLTGAKMGPLDGALIHVAYSRPEIFRVMLDDKSAVPQAAIVSLTHDFAFAPFSGAVNPADGQLYVAGFRIWGTVSRQVSGLARVRYTGAPSTLPAAVEPMDHGLLLRFDVALDAADTDPARFVVERWNYKRTHDYGSPHLRLDGSLGQDPMPVGGIYLSRDRRSLFIGVPDMRTGVMQMHVGWMLRTAAGGDFDGNAYLTPYELRPFHPVAEGFADLAVDLTPHHLPASRANAPASAAEGRRLYEFNGCMACHSVDGSKTFGPTWKSLAGSMVELADGTRVRADHAYLKESIMTPNAKIVKGFEVGMPNYAGILTDSQVESLILYIKSLK